MDKIKVVLLVMLSGCQAAPIAVPTLYQQCQSYIEESLPLCECGDAASAAGCRDGVVAGLLPAGAGNATPPAGFWTDPCRYVVGLTVSDSQFDQCLQELPNSQCSASPGGGSTYQPPAVCEPPAARYTVFRLSF